MLARADLDAVLIRDTQGCPEAFDIVLSKDGKIFTVRTIHSPG